MKFRFVDFLRSTIGDIKQNEKTLDRVSNINYSFFDEQPLNIFSMYLIKLLIKHMKLFQLKFLITSLLLISLSSLIQKRFKVNGEMIVWRDPHIDMENYYLYQIEDELNGNIMIFSNTDRRKKKKRYKFSCSICKKHQR